MAQDNFPPGLENPSFVDNFKWVPPFQQPIGRVKKNQVKQDFFFPQLDDRPIELSMEDPGLVLRLAPDEIRFQDFYGRIKFINKNIAKPATNVFLGVCLDCLMP